MFEQKITRRNIQPSGNDPGESVLPVACTSDQNHEKDTVPQSKYTVLLRIVSFTAVIFFFTYYISTWAPKDPKHTRQDTETKGDPMIQAVSTVAEIESTVYTSKTEHTSIWCFERRRQVSNTLSRPNVCTDI